jgi:uncharacterized protein YbjT (DUF2867 family)
VLDQLEPVRVLSRNPKNATWPAEVEVVAGDLSDPESLTAALDGVDTAFLFPVPGCGPAFTAAAQAAGIRKVVLLSSGAVIDDVDEQDGPIAAYHADIEHALCQSLLDWTFLRPVAFAANTLMWAGQTKSGDVVYGAYAGATGAPIHEADIAAAAVTVLTEDGHSGRIYDLTGPESLTHADQATILGEVAGRPIRFQEIPAEKAREAMAPHVPAPILDAMLRIWAESVGHAFPTTDTVEKLTGRPARTYREWAADHIAAF